MDMDMYILHVYMCLSVSSISICFYDVMHVCMYMLYVYVTLSVM